MTIGAWKETADRLLGLPHYGERAALQRKTEVSPLQWHPVATIDTAAPALLAAWVCCLEEAPHMRSAVRQQQAAIGVHDLGLPASLCGLLLSGRLAAALGGASAGFRALTWRILLTERPLPSGPRPPPVDLAAIAPDSEHCAWMIAADRQLLEFRLLHPHAAATATAIATPTTTLAEQFAAVEWRRTLRLVRNSCPGGRRRGRETGETPGPVASPVAAAALVCLFLNWARPIERALALQLAQEYVLPSVAPAPPGIVYPGGGGGALPSTPSLPEGW